jgi:hypothetical protein
MLPGGCFTFEYFHTHITDTLLVKVFPEGRKSHALRLRVHLDTFRVHYSNASKQCSENSLPTVRHSPYIHDLALSDFWFFGHTKISVAGRAFIDVDKLLEAAVEFLNEIQPFELRPAFRHRIERVKWVLANNGDCYHQ